MADRKTEIAAIVAKVQTLQPLGWEAKPTTSGVHITAPDGRGTVGLHYSGGSDRRSMLNLTADLKRLGFEEDLARLQTERVRERKTRIAADRAAIAAHELTSNTAATVFPSAASDEVPRPSVVRGMVTHSEVITPARAQALVDRPFTAALSNGQLLRQRRVKEAHVRDLAKVIARGEWQTTPNGVSLAPDGSILDGQHRLRAIASGSTPVEVRVTYNVPPDVFAAIDVGVNRTGADVLYTGGVTGGDTTMASTIKLLLCYDTWRANPDTAPSWTAWSREKVSHSQLYAGYAQYPDVAEHIRAVNADAKAARLVVASVAAFRQIAARAWPEGRELLTDFVIDLRPDRADRALERGNPALSLRIWNLTTPARGMRHRRELLLLLLLRHWNAYAAGKSLTYVRNTEESVMPSPYTPATRRRSAA